MRKLFFAFILVFFLSSFSFAQTVVPRATNGGATTSSINVSSSSAWSRVSPTVPRGLVVSVPSGAGSSICFTRDQTDCSLISDVTACPIPVAAGTAFEFLVSEDLWTGQVCGRRLSGTGAIAVGINRW